MAVTNFTLRETARKPLSGSAPAVASEVEAHKLINTLRQQRKDIAAK
ncbi:hypothetical protein [Erwinia typographi]|nr:hypothetical protein [Erwinia typographi]